MAIFQLTAPTAQQLTDAREHLRYWPYVKAFKPKDDTHLLVLVFIGRGISEERWNYYMVRSWELMNLCVKQYQTWFVPMNKMSISTFYCHHHNVFLRPDDMLKPFCDFIDELK